MTRMGLARPVTSPCGCSAKKASGIEIRFASRERAHIRAVASAAAASSRDRDGNPEHPTGNDARRQLTNSGLCLTLHPGPVMLETAEASGHASQHARTPE
jgi:hypothetical protein